MPSVGTTNEQADAGAGGILLHADTLFPTSAVCDVFSITRSEAVPSGTWQFDWPTDAWCHHLNESKSFDGEFAAGGRGGMHLWHAKDYPGWRSFGWSDPLAPSLVSYLPIIRQEGRFGGVTSGVINGLRNFNDLLERSWSYSELYARSPLLQKYGPSIARDNLRFYMSTDFTVDRGLILTVFLEATPDELKERPAHYVLANKHLHQAFFSRNGIERRTPLDHKREVWVAERCQHTAYAQFYIRRFTVGGAFENQISILMHPAQRNRLSYNPHGDLRYSGLRPIAAVLARDLKDIAGKIKHGRLVLEAGHHEALPEILNRIANSLPKLASSARTRDADPSLDAQIKLILELAKLIPESLTIDWKLKYVPGSPPRVEHVKRARGKVVPLRREIRSFCGTAFDVGAMHTRVLNNHEAPDAGADRISGPERERLMLGVFDLLKDSFQANGQVIAHQFMLSSRQLSNIRLVNERGEIRKNIQVLPKLIEQDAPTYVDTYAVQLVDRLGGVSQKFISDPVDIIYVDVKKNREPDHQELLFEEFGDVAGMSAENMKLGKLRQRFEALASTTESWANGGVSSFESLMTELLEMCGRRIEGAERVDGFLNASISDLLEGYIRPHWQTKMLLKEAAELLEQFAAGHGKESSEAQLSVLQDTVKHLEFVASLDQRKRLDRAVSAIRSFWGVQSYDSEDAWLAGFAVHNDGIVRIDGWQNSSALLHKVLAGFAGLKLGSGKAQETVADYIGRINAKFTEFDGWALKFVNAMEEASSDGRKYRRACADLYAEGFTLFNESYLLICSLGRALPDAQRAELYNAYGKHLRAIYPFLNEALKPLL